MKCKLCEIRKPRRYCLAVSGDICSMCCGNARERTVDCPLDCPYLQEAHDHERASEIDPGTLPNQDVKVTERFLIDHEFQVRLVLALINSAVMDIPGAADADLLQAMDAVIRTHRTLISGLHYDSRPVNPFAASIYEKIRAGLDELRKLLIEKGATPRDAEFLGVLVYIQQGAILRGNGRPRCKAFMDFLHRTHPGYKTPETASPLIVA